MIFIIEICLSSLSKSLSITSSFTAALDVSSLLGSSMGEPVEVQVSSMTGSGVALLSVAATASVRELKEKIEEKTGAHRAQQKLLMAGDHVKSSSRSVEIAWKWHGNGMETA